ncbi:hypothetical protein F2Q70_00010055 [Brassica cretica]|uniref:A-kinase anchor protein 7-like phosphoesterase domain-containing protein n=1 Tax=Brassica cretica TaxID=69181 RepID=A0A8S9M6I9_BRACR|nr:hypothetical protein F2Q70_00010055 [Brassica cretica]
MLWITGRLFIRLKGLDCMRGSLAKARVLYIPVEEIGDEGRLLQVITDAFVKAGLVLEKDANQSLKLHATVMNARYRKRKDKRKKMDTFDAREIHKQFGNEDWGEYLIQEAHLSQRFVFDKSESLKSQALPESQHVSAMCVTLSTAKEVSRGGSALIESYVATELSSTRPSLSSSATELSSTAMKLSLGGDRALSLCFSSNQRYKRKEPQTRRGQSRAIKTGPLEHVTDSTVRAS